MARIIKQIHTTLIKAKKTISVAESCTGGVASSFLTRLPGSSQYFILGIVAYSNKAKISILKIPENTIAQKGAVSQEVAKKMASQVKKISKTDFGIGITGIAGPTGATLNKPIGTVFIAVAAKNKIICNKFVFKGNRNDIQKTAALKSLQLLKDAFLYRY